jgi:phosphohistidine phosphatase
LLFNLPAMPRLLLLRHAKSSWGDPGAADRDRPLSPRGRRAAALIAEAIVARGYRPDRVLCSPARRTRETLAALTPLLGADLSVVFADELYEPPPSNYRAAIAVGGEDAQVLLVVGHNPATQATAIRFAGAGDGALLRRLGEKFPTGALAVIDFDDGEWSDLAPRSGRLVAFLTPRQVEGSGADDESED